MKSRIEEVLSRILSEKYDAKVKITFKEREDEQRRDYHGASGASSDAGKGTRKTKSKAKTS